MYSRMVRRNDRSPNKMILFKHSLPVHQFVTTRKSSSFSHFRDARSTVLWSGHSRTIACMNAILTPLQVIITATEIPQDSQGVSNGKLPRRSPNLNAFAERSFRSYAQPDNSSLQRTPEGKSAILCARAIGQPAQPVMLSPSPCDLILWSLQSSDPIVGEANSSPGS